jgi:hypothetical protein
VPVTSVEMGPFPVEPNGGVYFLADIVCGLVKVGMSASSVDRRITALQTASPHALEPLAVVRTRYGSVARSQMVRQHDGDQRVTCALLDGRRRSRGQWGVQVLRAARVDVTIA